MSRLPCFDSESQKEPGKINLTFSSLRWAVVVLTICLAPTNSWGKMVWLSNGDLIARAELIVIAKCIAKNDLEVLEVRKDPESKMTRITKEVESVLVPERVLKGDWPLTQKLMFKKEEKNYKGIEDSYKLPNKGDRVLLFLVKEEDGDWWFVNNQNGIWYLFTDDPEETAAKIKKVEEGLAQQAK
jgi:hypothetical protein